jgi:ferredoxin
MTDARTVVTETTVTIQLDGRTHTAEHRPGTTILQTARSIGLSPPSSCEAGNCATCLAMLTEGTVTMRVNDVLPDDEVEEGWILTCQSEPTSPTVSVVYDY